MLICKICATQCSIFGKPDTCYICGKCRLLIRDDVRYKDYTIEKRTLIADLFECDVPPVSVLFGGDSNVNQASTSRSSETSVAPSRRPRKQKFSLLSSTIPDLNKTVASEEENTVPSSTSTMPRKSAKRTSEGTLPAKKSNPNPVKSPCSKMIKKPLKRISETPKVYNKKTDNFTPKQAQRSAKNLQTNSDNMARRLSKRLRRQSVNSTFDMISMQSTSIWLRNRAIPPLDDGRLKAEDSIKRRRRTATDPPPATEVKAKIIKIEDDNRPKNSASKRYQLYSKLFKKPPKRVATAKQFKQPIKEECVTPNESNPNPKIIGFGHSPTDNTPLAYAMLPITDTNPGIVLEEIVLGHTETTTPLTTLIVVDPTNDVKNEEMINNESSDSSENRLLATPPPKFDTEQIILSQDQSLKALDAAISLIGLIARSFLSHNRSEADKNNSTQVATLSSTASSSTTSSLSSLEAVEAAIALMENLARIDSNDESSDSIARQALITTALPPKPSSSPADVILALIGSLGGTYSSPIKIETRATPLESFESFNSFARTYLTRTAPPITTWNAVDTVIALIGSVAGRYSPRIRTQTAEITEEIDEPSDSSAPLTTLKAVEAAIASLEERKENDTHSETTASVSSTNPIASTSSACTETQSEEMDKEDDDSLENTRLATTALKAVLSAIAETSSSHNESESEEPEEEDDDPIDDPPLTTTAEQTVSAIVATSASHTETKPEESEEKDDLATTEPQAALEAIGSTSSSCSKTKPEEKEKEDDDLLATAAAKSALKAVVSAIAATCASEIKNEPEEPEEEDDDFADLFKNPRLATPSPQRTVPAGAETSSSLIKTEPEEEDDDFAELFRNTRLATPSPQTTVPAGVGTSSSLIKTEPEEEDDDFAELFRNTRLATPSPQTTVPAGVGTSSSLIKTEPEEEDDDFAELFRNTRLATPSPQTTVPAGAGTSSSLIKTEPEEEDDDFAELFRNTRLATPSPQTTVPARAGASPPLLKTEPEEPEEEDDDPFYSFENRSTTAVAATSSSQIKAEPEEEDDDPFYSFEKRRRATTALEDLVLTIGATSSSQIKTEPEEEDDDFAELYKNTRLTTPSPETTPLLKTEPEEEDDDFDDLLENTRLAGTTSPATFKSGFTTAAPTSSSPIKTEPEEEHNPIPSFNNTHLATSSSYSSMRAVSPAIASTSTGLRSILYPIRRNAETTTDKKGNLLPIRKRKNLRVHYPPEF